MVYFLHFTLDQKRLFCQDSVSPNYVEKALVQNMFFGTVDGKKPGTSWYGKCPINFRVLYIPAGAGFLPSTVGKPPSCFEMSHKASQFQLPCMPLCHYPCSFLGHLTWKSMMFNRPFSTSNMSLGADYTPGSTKMLQWWNMGLWMMYLCIQKDGFSVSL